MIRPLIVIRRVPKIDFMRWHLFGLAFSVLLGWCRSGCSCRSGSIYGIDFKGGILIEAEHAGPADLAAMRAKLDALHIGEASLQSSARRTRC